MVTGTGAGGGGGGGSWHELLPGSQTCPASHAQLGAGVATVATDMAPNVIANKAATASVTRRINSLITGLPRLKSPTRPFEV
jgi:hypothetical protein